MKLLLLINLFFFSSLGVQASVKCIYDKEMGSTFTSDCLFNSKSCDRFSHETLVLEIADIDDSGQDLFKARGDLFSIELNNRLSKDSLILILG